MESCGRAVARLTSLPQGRFANRIGPDHRGRFDRFRDVIRRSQAKRETCIRRYEEGAASIRRGNLAAVSQRNDLTAACVLKTGFHLQQLAGLSVDDPIWAPKVFSKNRDRLLEAIPVPQ